MAELEKKNETALTSFSSGSSGDFSSGSSEDTGFEGWLLKFGTKEFPMEYVDEEGYTCTPNQRQETKAWQDNNGNLKRNTASHQRTKIEITTMEGLTTSQVQSITRVMKSSIIDKQQRKYKITYWNDEDGAYKDAIVYVPDIPFKYKMLDKEKNTSIYKSFRIALIEY